MGLRVDPRKSETDTVDLTLQLPQPFGVRERGVEGGTSER
jgi:hypothetical protein